MPDYADIWQKLDATCSAHDYAGWDPFDGLNSQLFQATPFAKSRWMRLAWLQFFKRSPVNFRALTLTPRKPNAKALSLLVRSYLLAGEKTKADYCLQKMLTLRSDASEWGEAAWGYPFDWQAKAFFVPKGKPNVICTLYAILALLEAEKAGLLEDATPYLEAAATFVQKHLVRRNEQGTYLAYIPGADAFVHNASLWGAYLLVEADARIGHSEWRELAVKAIQNSLQAQGKQGEWRYGTLPHHHFIDGFHTGYNLEALYRSNLHLQDSAIEGAIERGLAYYKQTFFDKQGRAGYYHDNPYPYDPHSAAQGVLTLNLLEPESSRELQERILRAVCQHMWDEKSQAFHYQQSKYTQNRITYHRWTQCWMHLALRQ